MLSTSDELLLFATNFQHYLDKIFIKYSKFRTKLQLSKIVFPAYDLSSHYYEIAFLWFECCGDNYLGLNLCKEFLQKCLNIFYDNQSIDICIKAKCLLSKVLQIMKSKWTEIRSLELQLRDNIYGESILIETLKISECYLAIGNFKKSDDYLFYFSKLLRNDKESAIKYSNYFAKLKALRSYGETIKATLDLQESLLFIDEGDHTDIEFISKENETELKNAFKAWKINCEMINKNKHFSKLKFIRELDEVKVNKDKVRIGKEVFIIYSDLRKYAIGFFSRNTKSYIKMEIKDKVLLEMLTNRNFTKTVSKNLIERVNVVLKSFAAEYFLNRPVNNKILILKNQKDLYFYLYLFLANSTDENIKFQIVGDLIFPSDKNKVTFELWKFLNKVFNNEIKIRENEFLHTLIKYFPNVFYGILLSKIPTLHNEEYKNIYKKLSLAYQVLGNRPLAEEFKKRFYQKRKEIKWNSKDIINSKAALTLPGDNFLNKPIQEIDFFTQILPNIDNIDGLTNFLHPCLKFVVICSNLSPTSSNWFEEETFFNILTKGYSTVSVLLNTCFLIYFTKTESWGIMFKLNDIPDAKVSGMLPEFCKYDEIRNIKYILSTIKTQIDFGFEDFNEENQNFGKVRPKTKKFDNSLLQIEELINEFSYKNFIEKCNRIFHYKVLNNEDVTTKADGTFNKNIYDVTSIEGILQLKLAVKSAREGYYLIIRNTNEKVEFDEKDNKTVQLIKSNDKYYVYSTGINGEWLETRVSPTNSKINALELFFFKHISVGAQKKKFISPIHNSILFYFLQEICGETKNSSTKSHYEDSFFTLIKCAEDHYVAIAIVKASFDDPVEYTIFQFDPLGKMKNFVDFLEETGKNFKYRFRPEMSFIQCKKENSETDSLIKSHFALKTIKYLWQQGKENLPLLSLYLKYEMICSAINVEKVKIWFLNNNKTNSLIIDNTDSDKKAHDQSDSYNKSFLQILREFDENFSCSLKDQSNEKNDHDSELVRLIKNNRGVSAIKQQK